jgi:hypothetical protein
MRGLHDLATLEKIAAQNGGASSEALANCLAALQGHFTGAGPSGEDVLAAWRQLVEGPHQGAGADRLRQLPREN